MNELVLPVPKTVLATYIVPVPTPMNTVEARQQASRAVEARLTGPLRTLTAEWLAKGVVKVGVEAADPPPPGLLDKELFGTPEQRVFLARARAFVRFSATQRASLIGMQEWKARGPAAALAAGLGAPVLDPQALQVLTAKDALAALPDTTLTIPASISDDMTIGLTFKSWVRIHDVGYQGVIAVMTDGMRRFGLPELRMGPASPDLREELTMLLNGVAFRTWSTWSPARKIPRRPPACSTCRASCGYRPRWTSTAATWTGQTASRTGAACSPSSGCGSIRRKAKTSGAG